LCLVLFSRIVVLSCEIDEDIPKLKTIAVSVLSDMGLNGAPLSKDLITEIVHPVSGFIGGVASQEVIKVCYAHLTQ
jgi:NEDD8-activating enzyme E1 regulatory subunit